LSYRRLGLLLALVAAAGVAAESRQARLTTQTWTVGSVERTALVAAPANTGLPLASGSESRGAPLVLVFHGHGGTSLNAARTFDIHTHWPEAVVIYPQGLNTPGLKTDPQGQRPGWQHTPGDQNDRDLKFVDAMLDWARTRFTIDPARVFAAGHSNGGSMTYTLWRARAGTFAAFAPSSSIFQRAVIAGATPKPAFIVAGEKDELVPFATQQLSLAATLRLNQAAATGTEWSGGAKIHASPIGADVVAYIHSGGHPMPADAGALMVKFFRTVASREARK
jgi:polyhydroxybutyrate depolymerase